MSQSPNQTSQSNVLLWLRSTFRLKHNAALATALSFEQPLMPVVLYTPKQAEPWAMGAASRWWFHHSITSLKNDFAKHHIPLTLRQTDNATQTLLALCRQANITTVIYDVRHEPWALKQAQDVESTLKDEGITCRGIHTQTLLHPGDWASKDGKPYQVYTPFWKHLTGNREVVHPPQITKATYHHLDNYPQSDDLNDWQLLPKLNWDKDFYNEWQPGEDGAWEKLNRFLDDGIEHYKEGRDIPSQQWISKLSPHLHFGEISVQGVWHHVINHAKTKRGQKARLTDNEQHFLKEVTWREFAYQLLHTFPETPTQNLRPAFDAYPWQSDPERLNRWQQGQTGIPIVDAGMRQLWKTGWMHNRVRMIAGSLLVKNCRIHWQEGAQWFWDTLVDADLASNTMGWQWVAGSGADAAPYFRIFNPVTQGERFDAEGDYVRQWVPELAKLPNSYIHKPWEAPPLVLKEAGITLGETYPEPMVDLAESRKEALAGYDDVKAAKESA